jgi:hypothetical protein
VILKLNDTTITPTFVRDEEMFVTTLVYNVPQLLPALSQNTVTVIWSDNTGTKHTNSGTFRVGAYTTLPASQALPVGAGVSTDSGFKVKIYQIQTNLTPVLFSQSRFSRDNAATTLLTSRLRMRMVTSPSLQ